MTIYIFRIKLKNKVKILSDKTKPNQFTFFSSEERWDQSLLRIFYKHIKTKGQSEKVPFEFLKTSH